MTEERTITLIDGLQALPVETEWVEFKKNDRDAPIFSEGRSV